MKYPGHALDSNKIKHWQTVIVNTVNVILLHSNKPAVMDLLLKKSTSGMNAVNKAGRTCLHVAVCKQHADCARVLLKYRCDVNVQVKFNSLSISVSISSIVFLSTICVHTATKICVRFTDSS